MEEFVEKKQKDEIDRGEVRTIFSTSHANIKASGKTMCENHVWRKLNDMEIECTKCPTALIVSVDDERLTAC